MHVGIPPHVTVLMEIEDMKKDLKAVLPAISASVEQIIHGVTQALETTALANNTVTYGGLHNAMGQTLTNVLESTGLMDMAKRFKAGTLADGPATLAQPNPAPVPPDGTPRDQDGL